MITVTDRAQTYFLKLLEQQGNKGMGIRVKASDPGTPKADCQLEFCEPSDLQGDEAEILCTGFSIFIDAPSIEYLDQAEFDFQTDSTGGQLTIRAPKLKASEPGPDASLDERIRYLLDSEINPQIAAHGGRVSLVEITEDKAAVLRFGGGCHGCGNVDVTLKQGIETTLRSRIPELTGVRDATDHSTGHAPYYRGKQGNSAVR